MADADSGQFSASTAGRSLRGGCSRTAVAARFEQDGVDGDDGSRWRSRQSGRQRIPAHQDGSAVSMATSSRSRRRSRSALSPADTASAAMGRAIRSAVARLSSRPRPRSGRATAPGVSRGHRQADDRRRRPREHGVRPRLVPYVDRPAVARSTSCMAQQLRCPRSGSGPSRSVTQAPEPSPARRPLATRLRKLRTRLTKRQSTCR